MQKRYSPTIVDSAHLNNNQVANASYDFSPSSLRYTVRPPDVHRETRNREKTDR